MGSGPTKSDKSLSLGLIETFKQAWADPDLRARLIFIMIMFGVYVLGVHIAVPIPGVASSKIADIINSTPALQVFNIFGGGALRRVSIFALGLGPYITASIIMQILQTAFPQWKKEMQEGGEYARQQNNKRTRLLALGLCLFQGLGLYKLLASGLGPEGNSFFAILTVVSCWTAGAMFVLWMGEQISEKGIGNGVSIMIFAGIMLSLPFQYERLANAARDGQISWFQVAGMVAIVLATTWVVVYFTVAQRRIPIQHMKRMIGTKMLGGQTSYLPLSVNMVGVIPLIFAQSLLYIPSSIGLAFKSTMPGVSQALENFQNWISPNGNISFFSFLPVNPFGILFYTGLIFFFTYFYTAIQFNVEDISDNLKRNGSFVPGVRPGKQTKDFLDGVISRITVVGAFFLAVVALVQYLAPAFVGISYQYVGVLGGTSLLILVSVALETLRQIEANLLMKQYGQ